MNLTARCYVAACLVALLGIVEQWTESTGIGAWRLAAALLVAGLLYEWLQARSARLRVAAVVERPLALGRAARLVLRFDNAGSRPLAVMFAAALPHEIGSAREVRRVDVPAGASASAAVDVRPTTLGRYRWHAVPVRIEGSFRLGWWSRRCRLDESVEVVPDLRQPPARSRGSAPGGGSERALRGSGSELLELREYRPGDPRHSVDWKATARSGRLTTRVYGQDQHLEIMLLLDVGRTAATEVGGLSQLGHFVNAAARFAEHAAALEDRVGLVAVADRPLASIPPRRGMPGVLGIRRALGALAARPVESDMLAGALQVQRLVRHRALVVMLTDLYGQDSAGRLSHGVRLLLPRHLLVVVALVGKEVVDLAQRRAVQWLDPYQSLAATEYRSRVWRNASALRRQGAHTVVAPPDALESRVLTLYRTLRAQRRV